MQHVCHTYGIPMMTVGRRPALWNSDPDSGFFPRSLRVAVGASLSLSRYFTFVCVCWSVDLCPVCPSFLPSSSMCSRVRRLGDGYWSCFGRRLCCNMNMNPFHHGLLHFSSWSRSISIHVIYAVRSMPTFTISFSNAKVLICYGSEQNSWKLGRLQARSEQ